MSAVAIVDGVAKHLARSMHGVQVAWGYFLVMLLGLVAVAVWRRTPVRRILYSGKPLLQAARAGCLVLSLSCLFFSLRYLPLAEATTIAFTAPLFIVALSGPMLGERVGVRRWMAVLAGMVGAVIVARPGMGLLHWSAAVAVVGAFFFAQFNIVTRKLGATDRPMTTLFYTFSIGTAILSLAMPILWVVPTVTDCVILAVSGVLGLFAHFAIFRALTLADASALAPLNYVRLLWAIAIGIVAYGDYPDLATVVGGAITVASGLYVVRYGGR